MVSFDGRRAVSLSPNDSGHARHGSVRGRAHDIHLPWHLAYAPSAFTLNIPIKRISREKQVADHPLAVVGLAHLWPRLQRFRQETIIAVNVGGCLIPTGLALYEAWRLSMMGQEAILGGTVAIIANTIACYLIARHRTSVSPYRLWFHRSLQWGWHGFSHLTKRQRSRSWPASSALWSAQIFLICRMWNEPKSASSASEEPGHSTGSSSQASSPPTSIRDIPRARTRKASTAEKRSPTDVGLLVHWRGCQLRQRRTLVFRMLSIETCFGVELGSGLLAGTLRPARA